MTDFVRTMKDWRRMCKTQDNTTREACSSCPMGDDGKSCMAVYEDEFETVDFAHIENTVTEWAAEHPEPKYPTWWKYMCMIGVIPDELGDKTLGEMAVYSLMNTHIQSDIAEKLGIEPKEG